MTFFIIESESLFGTSVLVSGQAFVLRNFAKKGRAYFEKLSAVLEQAVNS